MAGNRRIAILGCGKIGESLLSGLLSSGWRQPGDIVVTGRREERLAELRERHGVEATLSNSEAARGAGIVVVAVKPPGFEGLLAEIGPTLRVGPRVLRPPRGGDDRGRDPARARARDLDSARRPDDARHREAAPRPEDAPGRAPRGGDVPRRHDDRRDPRARAGGRARSVLERD